MSKRIPLRGAKMLVTGAGSGIGKLIAVEAAARGAKLILWDLDLGAAQKTATAIQDAGGEAIAYKVNLADLKSIEKTADATLKQQGRVDILVNCAGVVSGKSVLDLSDKEIELTYQVNTLALYRTTKIFLPGMIARDRGMIVNIASAAALIGVAKQSDYSGSKAAALNFTEALRGELAKQGANVNTLTVCPFYVNTGMFEGVTTRFPLLLPIMDEDVVAEKIIRAMECGRHLLILPPFARISSVMLGIFPTGLRDWFANLFGLNAGMDEFIGRSKKSS